ncbi:MAG: Flp family type IVb pilin [Nocardioidaceae bacterium]|nr:Flp family type IVb pilin [Nocardioidaceae bacterium]
MHPAATVFRTGRSRRDEHGASAVEYALLVSLITAVIVVAVLALGKRRRRSVQRHQHQRVQRPEQGRGTDHRVRRVRLTRASRVAADEGQQCGRRAGQRSRAAQASASATRSTGEGWPDSNRHGQAGSGSSR